MVYFPTVTVIIRCVFEKGGKYSALFRRLFVSNIKMISYERIEVKELTLKIKGSECMICHYFCDSDGFKYQPYVCNGCHDFSMSVQNLNDFFIITVKNIDYRVYITGVDKKAAMYLLSNSVLSDKCVLNRILVMLKLLKKVLWWNLF